LNYLEKNVKISGFHQTDTFHKELSKMTYLHQGDILLITKHLHYHTSHKLLPPLLVFPMKDPKGPWEILPSSFSEQGMLAQYKPKEHYPLNLSFKCNTNLNKIQVIATPIR
jgi:hypothetical protein